MKSLIKHLSQICLILLISNTSVLCGEISKADRDKAIEHLKNTRDLLLKTIKGLNQSQLDYKPHAESWSIAECVEHITISEEIIFQMAQGSLKEDVEGGQSAMTDEALLGIITDRSNKVKTREAFEPSNKYGSYKSTLKAFKEKRKSNIEYLKNTTDDLRGHYFEFPFGMADSYQVLLFMSGHSERHINQILEIKRSNSFPI